MHKVNGIILASGEGSRLAKKSRQFGLPKHLLPIGESSSIGMLIEEMRCCVERISIVIPEKWQRVYESAPFAGDKDIHFLMKKSGGFSEDFRLASQCSGRDWNLLAVGDIIFPAGELRKFYTKFIDSGGFNSFASRGKMLHLGLDRDRLRTLFWPTVVDVRMVAAMVHRDFFAKLQSVNPESPLAVLSFFIRGFWGRRISISPLKTRINLNTDADYTLAASLDFSQEAQRNRHENNR